MDESEASRSDAVTGKAIVEEMIAFHARKQVALLCELVLRRLQEDRPIDTHELREIFGEALEQFTRDSDE